MVFGYCALKAAVLQARWPRGTPTPALPHTVGRGRRQLSLLIPPDLLLSSKPISSQHRAENTLSGFQLYSSF